MNRGFPWVRLTVLFVLIAVSVFSIVHGGGKPASSQHSPSPAPSSRPSPTPAQSAGAPSASPNNAQSPLISAMEQVMGQPRNMHVSFLGADLGGSLRIDANVDGHGDLSGTYSRQGYKASIVVTQHTVYMNGAETVARFLNQPEDPQLSGWVRLPSSADPGILATLANASQFSQCLRDTDKGPLVVARTLTAGGGSAVELAPPTNSDGSGTQPWQLHIAATGTPYLLSWQVLFANGAEPPSCSDSTSPLLEGQRAGITGVFSFSDFGTPVAQITAPPNPTSYPAS